MGEVPRIDALLENATWLRGLAYQLLADRGLADDALQETWIAALSERADIAAQKPWLARVLRNFALQRGRSEAARARREQRAARPERLPSSDETVARAELHAKLVRAVLALDEPYRATILWRYFDGLSAETIAQRAGIDPATVRSRIARARERLRASLMENGGEAPERWLAALLPAGVRPVEPSTAITGGALAGAGGSLMGAKLLVGVGVLALVAAVFLWRDRSGGQAAPPEVATSSKPAASTGTPSQTPISSAEPGLERSTAPVDNATGTSASRAASSRWRGIVLSEDARAPIEGARVACKRGTERVAATPEAEAQRTRQVSLSDALGNFELEISSDPKDGLWVEADGFFGFNLAAGDLPRDSSTSIEVLLAPLGTLELEVVDDAERPHADLLVQYSIDVNRGSQEFMWSYRRDITAGRTDGAGHLRLAGLPCGMPIRLRYGDHAASANFLGVVHIDPQLRVLSHRVKLARTATIRGILVQADKRPAADIQVEWQTYPRGWSDPTRLVSSADGEFEIADIKPEPGEFRLDLPGFEPRRLAPRIGEVVDLGTIELPALVELGGRLVSRWMRPGHLEEALAYVEVRAFRGGRTLAEFASNEGALRRNGAEFRGNVTAGPLELVVTRGGSWYPGIPFRGEILARLELESARTGLEIVIDEHAGALEVQLGDERPIAEGPLIAHLYAMDGDVPEPMALVLEASPDVEGLARFAPITPGRYRCTLSFQGGPPASVEDVVILSGQLARWERPVFASFAIFGSVRDARGKAVADVAIKTDKFQTEGLSTTDSQGQFRLEGLAPGFHDLFVRHGDLGLEERRGVAVFAREGTRVDFVLAGFASVIGHVTSGRAPVAGLSIGAQPFRSNDTFNSITDEHGTFRLERLPAGRLRFWSSRNFVEVRDLVAGETLEVRIEMAKPSLLTFLKDNVPLEDVIAAHAIAFDDEMSKRPHWQSGELLHGEVEMELPAGRVLFEVNRASFGWNRSWLALVDRPGTAVELGRNSVAIESSGIWNGPLPIATLVSIEGREVINEWGSEIVLAVERGSDGRILVACLPDAARIMVAGYDSRGARHETTVDVPATRSIRWP